MATWLGFDEAKRRFATYFAEDYAEDEFSRLHLRLEGDSTSWAMLSADGRYRYLLGREWLAGAPATMVFVMLNPSTADALKDDATIRKCVGFAKLHDCQAILVVNLFAWRSRFPRDLELAAIKGLDPVGPLNREVLLWALTPPNPYGQNVYVGAWGVIPRPVRRIAAPSVHAALAFPLECFGKTKGSDPRHPLMLAYSSPRARLT